MTHPTEVFFEVGRSEFDALSEEGVTGIPAKPFFVCRHDMSSDQRVYDLSWGTFPAGHTDERAQRRPQASTHCRCWQPDVRTITFWRGTRDRVSREYLGMEFADWAPGWWFLRLGTRAS